MDAKLFCRLAGELMRHPAVAYHEHAVRGQVERICARHGLDFRRDPFGNVFVRWAPAPRKRPVVLAAHLDHPGFEVRRRLAGGRWTARFLGGVPDAFFRRRLPLRLMPGEVPARLGRRVSRERDFEVQPEKSVRVRPRYAVWELEDFALRRGRIYGRACDDLVGVAAVLGTLIELKRSRAKAHAIGLITRAEEIGFLGALAAALGGQIPRNSLVISLETSRELPGVRMGGGVIIRVGDRTSIFNSEATRFLGEVAERLRKQERGFSFQRGLMSGGTCEGTAYQEFGFQTAAVCVALGNYHNCSAGNRIRAEYVNLRDACGMVELLAAVTKQMDQYDAWTKLLPKRLMKLWWGSKKRLRQSSQISAMS